MRIRKKPMEINGKMVYTTGEMAKILGVHSETVRRHRKEFKTKKIGRNHSILGQNVLDYLGTATDH